MITSRLGELKYEKHDLSFVSACFLNGHKNQDKLAPISLRQKMKAKELICSPAKGKQFVWGRSPQMMNMREVCVRYYKEKIKIRNSNEEKKINKS